MEPKFLIELIVSPFILPCMSRMDRWFAERPSPAEIACALAGDKFWRDARLRLIGTHPDWPDAAFLLRLDEAVAHAFVLVLSGLPAARRRDFAEAFYARRDGSGEELSRDSRERLALAAAAVLGLGELLDDPAIADARTVDLLHAAAQQDDLTQTPGSAVDELRNRIARIRLNVEFEDPADPRGAAALAVAETLDPAGDVVDAKEVFARVAWAAVETQATRDVLE